MHGVVPLTASFRLFSDFPCLDPNFVRAIAETETTGLLDRPARAVAGARCSCGLPIAIPTSVPTCDGGYRQRTPHSRYENGHGPARTGEHAAPRAGALGKGNRPGATPKARSSDAT